MLANSEELRAHCRALLTRFPDLAPAELADLKDCFARRASSLDVAILSMDETIRLNYAAFRKAHVDRFTAKDAIIFVLFAMLTAAITVWLGYGGI